ncbi:MAG: hypothetical protein A2Y40_10710 [Candidatus Margulisbacteria bacterium GWF2_35_9]|nr:MAG: hypothetical protein A2Y40_10710 [Candidatus Margulisbacteria bacterium GWF2_35_9]
MKNQEIEVVIKKNLLKVNKPIQYLGNELNVIKKDWDSAKTKLCFVYPDKYEIGMSNMALQIFYKIINQNTDHLLERCFIPDKDMIDFLKDKQVPLFALESTRPLTDFNALAFSFSTELSYTNALLALDLGHIPMTCKERINDDSIPIIFAGGGAVVNPLPLSDFFDFFVIGDGEEVLEHICDVIYKCKYEKKISKYDTIKALSELDHIYAPSFHRSDKIVKKATFSDVNNKKYLVEKPLVPLIKVVHDRFSIELMRGCPRICRFCQASYINKPLRIREKEVLLNQAKAVISNTGYDELSLSSLSSSDYPQVINLLTELDSQCNHQHVKLSLPSLRIDTHSLEMSEITNKLKESGVTLAPEAGSQFLRDVINKNINEQEILDTIKTAAVNSKKSIKLYFMIGLPGEEQQDLQAIVNLAFRIIHYIKPARNKLTINISNFVPKPFTPFQWAKQDDMETINTKLSFFKKELRHKQLELRWTDPKLSILEGILTRGDEKIGKLILAAYRQGAIFDAWYDHFNFEYWMKAAEAEGISINDYLVDHNPEDVLPWSFIDTGVKINTLKNEYQKALSTKR